MNAAQVSGLLGAASDKEKAAMLKAIRRMTSTGAAWAEVAPDFDRECGTDDAQAAVAADAMIAPPIHRTEQAA